MLVVEIHWWTQFCILFLFVDFNYMQNVFVQLIVSLQDIILTYHHKTEYVLLYFNQLNHCIPISYKIILLMLCYVLLHKLQLYNLL